MTTPIQSSTRLHGRWLHLARLAWLLVILLAFIKLVFGLPLYYTEKARLCTASEAVCSQGISLNLAQVLALESSGVTLPAYARVVLAWEVITVIIWAGVGLLIFLLRSDDWLALIVSAMMILFTSGGYEEVIRSTYPAWALPADLIFNLGNILLFLFIGLFPGGRFSPHWMRWYWLAMITISIPPASLWSLYTNIENIVFGLFWISFLILGPYSLIYRYRKDSTAVERQQTKWVVLGFATFAGLLLTLFAILNLFNGSNLGDIWIQNFGLSSTALLIPLSVGLSVLRYRLWDIDLIIRRTLVYSALTTTVALIFFGSVALLQNLFRVLTGQSQSAAVTVLSTLFIAALFNPLRKRIQTDIDRRFYRRKYDAQKTLDAFAVRARDEVELEKLTEHLVGVVQETLQPASVSLWLRKGEW